MFIMLTSGILPGTNQHRTSLSDILKAFKNKVYICDLKQVVHILL